LHIAASAIGQETKETPMSLYEHVFLARQDLSQAQVDALAENATKIITDNKGKVVKTESWGLRTLTYKIQKNRKAHFVMLDVDASGDAIAELERQTRMNEDVIRYMTVRVEKHEDGPSVMMRKSDRPERSERGGFGGDRPDRGDRDRGAPRPDRGDRGGFGGGDRDRAPRAEQEA
jgi:small subunit ribosomal protein S6